MSIGSLIIKIDILKDENDYLRAIAKEQHQALKMASDSIIALFRACEPSGNTKYGNRFAEEDNGYIALKASIEKYEALIK